MKYKTLVRLSLRVLGVFLFVQGITSLLMQVGWTVGMTSSERAIQANLAILRASDKTLGVLVDIVS